jgi:2-iminobutanoate/2-iminopropanoate deaminase
MKKTQINPWSWQNQYSYSQAWKIDTPASLIYVSGQASMSSEGHVLHEDDFENQVRQTYANLETVLEHAGASLNDVIKLGVYLTDIDNFPKYKEIQAEKFTETKPADTTVIVMSLALPALMVEVEAVAAIPLK